MQVPPLWAAHCAGVLASLDSDCRVKRYPELGHEVNTAVQHDLQLWLAAILQGTGRGRHK